MGSSALRLLTHPDSPDSPCNIKRSFTKSWKSALALLGSAYKARNKLGFHHLMLEAVARGLFQLHREAFGKN